MKMKICKWKRFRSVGVCVCVCLVRFSRLSGELLVEIDKILLANFNWIVVNVRKSSKNIILSINWLEIAVHLNVVLCTIACTRQKKNQSRLSLTCQPFCEQSILVESALNGSDIKKNQHFHANTLTDKPIVYSNKCNHQANEYISTVVDSPHCLLV